jgi:hypothetical protein
MAKNRVQLDKNFVSEVTIAASGGTSASMRKFRAKHTTLDEIAVQIINEAQRLADSPSNRVRSRGGLPSSTSGGRRNLQYPFRRSSPPGTRTYRASFTHRIAKRNGRLTILIENTHPHASDVEYGTKRNGSRIRPQKVDYLTLPLTQAKYRKMKKYVPVAKRGPAKSKKRNMNKSFPAMAKSGKYAGKPVLMTRSVRTYGGYGIMRRAMNNIAKLYF